MQNPKCCLYNTANKQPSHVNKQVWMKNLPHFQINTAANSHRILQKRVWTRQQLHLGGSSFRIRRIWNSSCRLYVWICSDILPERSHTFNNHNTDLCDPTTLARVHSRPLHAQNKAAQRCISHSCVTQILPPVTPAEMGGIVWLLNNQQLF